MIEQSTEFQQARCTTTYENGKLSHMNWMLCKSTAEIDNMDFSASTPLSSSSAPSPPLVVTGSEATGGGDGRIKLRTLRVIVKMPNGTNDYCMIANSIDDDSFLKGRMKEKHGYPVERQIELQKGVLNFTKKNDDEVTMYMRIKHDEADIIMDEDHNDTTEEDKRVIGVVSVKTLSGRLLVIQVLPGDSLMQVMRRIQYHEGMPTCKQVLIFAGKLLEDATSSVTPYLQGVIKMATTVRECNVFSITGNFSENGAFKFQLDLRGEDEIGYVRSALANRLQVPPKFVTVSIGRRQLGKDEDHKEVSDFANGDFINFDFRIG